MNNDVGNLALVRELPLGQTPRITFYYPMDSYEDAVEFAMRNGGTVVENDGRYSVRSV